MRKRESKILVVVLCSLALMFVGIILAFIGQVMLFFTFFLSSFGLIMLIFTSINFTEWRKLRRRPSKPILTCLPRAQTYELLLDFFSKKRKLRRWKELYFSKPSQIILETWAEMGRFSRFFPSKLTIHINQSNDGSEIELEFNLKKVYAVISAVAIYTISKMFWTFTSLSNRPFVWSFFLFWILLLIGAIQIPFITKINQRQYFRRKIRRCLAKQEKNHF